MCEVPGTRRLPDQDTHPARTSYGNTALSHVIGSVGVHRVICDFGLASSPVRKPSSICYKYFSSLRHIPYRIL